MAPRFRHRLGQPTDSIQDLVFQVVGELGLANPGGSGQTVLLRD
jgi:hypothetical protein